MADLTSEQTEDQVLKATRHHEVKDKDDDDNPLNLQDNEEHQNNQDDEEAIKNDKLSEAAQALHRDLVEELDKDTGPNTKDGDKGVPGKKGGTLTRMLKGIRLDKEKENTEESAAKMSPNRSISKIFQRINPVGKVSRESFSKVMHRIGDALHKKSGDEEECGKGKGKDQEVSNSKESRKSEHNKKTEEKEFEVGKPETSTN